VPQVDLRAIRTFPQLVKYLRDELDWPIESSNFEDLTFDYSAEELGLDSSSAAKIKEIKQLRPLESKQPWGIFFVNFEPQRLPVVALRRILRALVVKKRESVNRSQQATWQLHDLLFISTYGETNHRDITFAHFAEEPGQGDLPVLRVLGWDDEDTALHTAHTDKMLRERLCWPKDTKDMEKWRATWSSAFTLRHLQVVRTSKELALELAVLAQKIRKRAKTVLALETEKGQLRKLHTAFKQALIHDLTEDDFADMYAQTISYGLLTARISRPSGIVADNLTDMVPVTNPFLKELLETFLNVGGRKGKIDFDELGISEVVHLLRDADMEAVLRDFGDRNPDEDPAIHFYELFLKEYDPKKRMQRGVFYTPRPVVSFIVRSVHELLQKEFGLADGLADTTTWGEMSARQKDLKIPHGVVAKEPFVKVLDPATGTGTFLVETIDVIYETMRSKWLKAGHMALEIPNLWNQYVPKHLLPRIYGYELLMAPYAIAHMKIGLKLYETGYRFGSDERARVYLTNSLEPAGDNKRQREFEEWAPALAHEAKSVNAIKRGERFSVVIGNPPYSGVSANRGIWIEELLKGHDSNNQNLANYYEVDGESLNEKKVWLKDDYVKFIRLSHFMLEQTGLGVHGMITNHSFLDSPTCRGMRYQLLGFFSSIRCVDLHGSTKRDEVAPDGIVDENVFDILPGVAIAVCSKAVARGGCSVETFDLWGTRAFKSDWLLSLSESRINFASLQPRSPYYLFAKRQLDHQDEYRAFHSLKDIFPFYGTGIQTSRDDFGTDYDLSTLENRLRRFFDRRHSDTEVTREFGISDTRGWKIGDIRQSSSFGLVKKGITKYLFRVFDTRWIALTKDIVDWPRLEVMSCVSPNRPGLLCSRQQATAGFRHALVVNCPVDMFCISNKSREGQTLFPLFVQDAKSLFHSDNTQSWKANLGKGFIAELTKNCSVSVTDSNAGQILSYIYALLHSDVYRVRYSDLLKMDYPRLPVARTAELFLALIERGDQLIGLHTLVSHRLDKPIAQYTGASCPEIGKVGFSQGTVWLSNDRVCGFRGVPEAVWNFHIGGYQVCEKWLKDRKGRTLSKDDINHYQKIIVALSETIRIMAEIDKVIDAHGGWPGAFVAVQPSSTGKVPS
jgi:predicted helicase